MPRSNIVGIYEVDQFQQYSTWHQHIRPHIPFYDQREKTIRIVEFEDTVELNRFNDEGDENHVFIDFDQIPALIEALNNALKRHSANVGGHAQA